MKNFAQKMAWGVGLVLAVVTSASATSQEQATWLQTNLLEKTTAPAVTNLPYVLILGDSISLGYTPYVRAKLKGVANVSRPMENCGPSQNYLLKMKRWVGKRHWDVIHVNFGIWDIHLIKGSRTGMNFMPKNAIKDKTLQPVARGVAIRDLGYSVRTPTTVYEKNLRTILAFLKKHADHVVFGLTTPMLGYGYQRGDCLGRIEAYNELAVAVCEEMGVEVNDLYGTVAHSLDLQTDGCHFCGKGYEMLADAVCAKVKEKLAQPRSEK